MHSNEIEIVKKIQKGDSEKFVELYDIYVDKIYNFIYYKSGNKKDSQDVTSDTFVKAFANIKSFKSNGKMKFSSWLYTIANNTFIDYCRHNSKEISLDPIINTLYDNKKILNDVDNNIKLDQILNYLNTLDEDKKNIFVMRIGDGLSYEEISTILGKKVNNCKVIFHRTLKDIVNRFGVVMLLLFII